MKKTIRQVIENSGWGDNTFEPRGISGILRLLEQCSLSKSVQICRGEPRFYQECRPSIARDKELEDSVYQNGEAHLIAQFRRRISSLLTANEVELTRSVWGTLVLMQHYRAPTRLLDWTLSPWVAAYFACVSFLDQDGFIWIVGNDELQRSTLPHIPEILSPPELDALYSATRLKEWQQMFEKSEWLVHMQPSRSTSRLTAQQGLFTVGNPISLDHRSWIGSHTAKASLSVILIKSSLKRDLIRVLHSMNISANSLYPDLTGAGDSTNSIITGRITISAPVDDWSFSRSAFKDSLGVDE